MMVKRLKRALLFLWALLILLPLSLLAGLLGVVEMAASLSLVLNGELEALAVVAFLLMGWTGLICAWLIYYEWIGPKAHFTRRRLKLAGLFLGLLAACWLAWHLQWPVDAAVIYAVLAIGSAGALIFVLVWDKKTEAQLSSSFFCSRRSLLP
jgi:hypothetical protein